MSKVQTSERSVDTEGFLLVNPASRCELATRSTVPLAPAGTKTPLPLRVRRRSLLHVKNHAPPGFGATIYIGGDGVDTTTAYPLAVGAEIRLPLTARVLVDIASGSQTSSARSLEHG